MPELRAIPLSLIDEPPMPMRATMDDEGLRELGESIRIVGLQQPITVIEFTSEEPCSQPEACKNECTCKQFVQVRFRIVTGHRRFIASQQIHAPDILCIVRQPGEVEEVAAMIAENLCREDVNAAEEAIWLAQLVELHSYTEADLMRVTKRNADYIGDRFRLLRSDELVFRAVLDKAINFSVARELNKCPKEDMRRYYLDAAVRGGHSARTVRGWIQEWAAQQVLQQPAVKLPAPSTAPVEVAEVKNRCASCGGDKDPYALFWLQIHRRCWDEIQRAIGAMASA